MKHLIKLRFFTVFLFAFLLPLKLSLSNFFLILFFVFTLILFIVEQKKTVNFKALKFSTILILLPLIFSLFYTTNLETGISDIGSKITYLLIPIFFSITKNKDYKLIYTFAKKGILFGTTLALTVLITCKIYNLFILGNTHFIELFNYENTRVNFTKILKIHPSYLGIYIIFTTIISIEFVKKSKKFIFLIIPLQSLFFLGILLINSRIIFFIYLVVLLIYLVRYLILLFNTESYKLFFGLIIFLISISVLSFYQIKKTYIYYRFTKELKWELSKEVNSFYIKNSKSKSDPRLARIKVSLELIKEKPIFGYGVSSEKSILTKKYKENNMVASFENKYDSHNQFLSILTETGLFGLSFFVFFLFSNFCFSFKYKDLEYFLLLFSVSIICLVENYLNRNNGITFFAFFSSIYLFSHFKKPTK